MKKLILLFLIMLISPVFASDKVHVRALDDFSTVEPKETFSVELIEDSSINGVFMLKGDKINCSLLKVTDPTRGKRDAKIFFVLNDYEDKSGSHEIKPLVVAKYAKSVLSVEEVKKTPKRKYVKKAIGTVGNFFYKGVSYGVSFVDGVAQNEEGNRLKSGAKQVYEDSFLSLVEEGQQIEIKTGDEFYFIAKAAKESETQEAPEVSESQEEKE